MATALAATVHAQCPLCGTSILSVSRGGRVDSEDLRAVPLYNTRGSGEGFMVCDDCGLLTSLPSDITLN
jgi:hypothetical protein